MDASASKAYLQPLIRTTQTVEIDVNVEYLRMETNSSQSKLRSNATYRRIVAGSARFATVPRIAKTSEVQARFDELAASSPEIASALAARSLDMTIDLGQPASFATTLCEDTRSWQRVSHPDVSTTLVTEGIGDSPAQRATVVRGGKTVLIQDRAWRRTSRAWQLTTVRSRTPDNAYVENVAIRRPQSAGADIASETVSADVKRVKCAPAELSVRRSPSQRSSASVPRSLSAFESAASVSMSVVCADGPTCDELMTQWQDALVDVVDAHAATGAVCLAILLPPPWNAVAAAACAAAILHESVMIFRANRARDRYWACMRARNQLQTRFMQPERPVAVSLSAVTVSAMNAGVSASVECWDEVLRDEGSSPGYGGTDYGRFGCSSETWEISYDGGETWSPIQVMVCEAA